MKCECAEAVSICMVKVMDQWQAFVNTGMNHEVPQQLERSWLCDQFQVNL
jgi:hypothetical protein